MIDYGQDYPDPFADDPPPVDSDQPLTELAHARRLVGMFGDQIRYVVPWRKWLVWDGQRWKADDTGQVWRYAKKIADSVPEEEGITYPHRGGYLRDDQPCRH